MAARIERRHDWDVLSEARLLFHPTLGWTRRRLRRARFSAEKVSGESHVRRGHRSRARRDGCGKFEELVFWKIERSVDDSERARDRGTGKRHVEKVSLLFRLISERNISLYERVHARVLREELVCRRRQSSEDDERQGGLRMMYDEMK